MNVLLVAATPFELAPLQTHFEQHYRLRQGGYVRGTLRVAQLVTGVGLPLTILQLTKALARQRYDLVINAGVAGSFRSDWALGSVVHVVSQRFGDLGVDEADGRFTDLFELGLQAPDTLPFQRGRLLNPWAADAPDFLPKAQGLTVQRVHGTADRIAATRAKYPDVEVESMEGAGVFLTCLEYQQPFLEIRALSNYVEVRNRAGWQLGPAIQALNSTLEALLNTFA